jgi:hypothetical protein
MSRPIEVCDVNLRVQPRGSWPAIDEATLVTWFAQVVEVVENVSGLERPPTFRDAKKLWGSRLGMESTPLPRPGKQFEDVLINVVSPSGTLGFAVGCLDHVAYLAVNVSGVSGGERNGEIRLRLARFFEEVLPLFASGSLSRDTRFSSSPQLGMLVRGQTWYHNDALNENLLAPAWAVTVSHEERALLPDNLIELTPADSNMVVIRAPFSPDCRDQVQWETWYRLLDPVLGPIVFDAPDARDNVVPL